MYVFFIFFIALRTVQSFTEIDVTHFVNVPCKDYGHPLFTKNPRYAYSEHLLQLPFTYRLRCKDLSVKIMNIHFFTLHVIFHRQLEKWISTNGSWHIGIMRVEQEVVRVGDRSNVLLRNVRNIIGMG